MTGRTSPRCDGGSASAVVLSLLVVVALTCLATADAASVLLSRVRAQSAADAAALAAAASQWRFGPGDDPGRAAVAVATANGAMVESCECPPDGTRAVMTVSVATRVRLLRTAPAVVHATAEARLDPGAIFRPGS